MPLPHCLRPAVVLLVLCPALTQAAEVAFLYSKYQETVFAYMPGEYRGQYEAAGACLEEAGFAWDRLDSETVEGGALVKQGYRVLVISYTGVMSRAEAAAIGDFVNRGGRIFAVYSACDSEFRDGKAVPTGHCLIAAALGMDAIGAGEGARYLKVEEAGHPLVRLLPRFLYNAHGYSVRMIPLAGEKVIAGWVGEDFTTAPFPAREAGGILLSPAAVYFSAFLWRLPEAKIIVANALSFLLGRQPAGGEVAWARAEKAAPVAHGLNLAYARTATEDVDAIGWPIATSDGGRRRPTTAVVYPVGATEAYFVAKRLARALACPLAPDRAVVRDNLRASYDLLVVGRLFPDRCENPLGNLIRGVAPVLAEQAGATGKAVIRLAPEEPGGVKRLLLVAGADLPGLERAEAIVRRGLTRDREADQTPLLLWQPRSAFGDLVYPWTEAGPPVSTVTMPAAINQHARCQFVATNAASRRTLDLDLEVTALAGPAGAILSERVQLLATRYVRSSISKIDEPHPLVPTRHVSLDPGAHQQLWLIVDTAGAKPGEYRGQVKLRDDRRQGVGSLAVALTVDPITLAPKNRHDLLTAVWDYAVSGHMHGALLGYPPGDRTPESVRAARRRWGEHYERYFRDYWQAYVRDLEDHGVNMMFLATTMAMPQYQVDGRTLDEGNLEKLIRYGKDHGFRLFIFTQILGQGCYYPDSDRITGDDSAMLSPAWDEAYKKILRAYVDLARQTGLDFKEWAIYPYDEPHKDQDRRIINHVGKLIDEVDARIQLWADPMRPPDPALDALEFWKSMEKSIDIWWPADGYIAPGTDTLKYVQSLGKPFGFYRCAAYATKDRSRVRPDSYYRAFGWQVTRLGAAGMGFWTWCAWLGDSWDDEDDASREGDGAVIYEGPEGPVTTIDWEAWGEGVDDYKYLAALKTAVAARETKRGKDDPLCFEARRLMTEAVAKVTANIREADNQRARLREMILRLGR